MKRGDEAASELASRWMRKAEEDLTLARHGLRLRKGCPFGLVCFHAQQCAEKYIKAALTVRGIDFGKIHDLADLARLLPGDIGVGVSRRTLDTLTVYAVQPRYPHAGPSPTRGKAHSAIRAAAIIREVLREHLPATEKRR